MSIVSKNRLEINSREKTRAITQKTMCTKLTCKYKKYFKKNLIGKTHVRIENIYAQYQIKKTFNKSCVNNECER